MARSAADWAKLVGAPTALLRAEIWRALQHVKAGGGDHTELSWPELIQRWRPSEKDDRTVEARWRRGLLSDTGVEVMTMGEALEALYVLKDRLLPGETPHVRRLVNDEPEPTDRMRKIFYPDSQTEQDVRGLEGTWRLVHQRSDGKGFLSWGLKISPTIEPHGGPGAWFDMETRIPITASRRNYVDGTQQIREAITGAVHGAGAMFYLIGTDHDRRLVTGSFQSSGGQIPANTFDRAHGLIQRSGSRGLYAALAVLSRVDSIDDRDTGSFATDSSEDCFSDGLAADMATIAASSSRTGSSACLLSLLSANDVYGT